MRNHDETLTRIRLANPEQAVDSDEMAVLRAMIDEEIAAPSPRRRRSWSTEPVAGRRVRPVLVAALTALVILALFLPLRYIGERDDTRDVAATTPPPPTVAPSSTPPSPSSTPPSTTTTTKPPTSLAPAVTVAPLSVDPRDLEWRRVDMPGLSGKYLWFDSVIAGGPGLIAVGSANDWGDPFIWTSPDGVEWSPASVEMSGNHGWAFDVAPGGPGYVAVGSSIWTSSDGITWQYAELEDPIVGELRAATVGGPGMVAVGRFNGELASIYTSTDGVRWSLIPQEGAPQGQHESEITDIVAGGPGLVAVGHLGGIGAVWTSPDGFEWSRVPHDSEVFGRGTEGTELFSIAADDSGFVAVGRITDDGTMGVWRSSDGLDWSVVPLDPDVLNESHELMTVISTEQGFIAAGAGADRDGGVWFSPDGITWTRLQTEGALGDADVQWISDITVFGNSVIAVGVRFFEDASVEEVGIGSSEVVWIGEPSQR